MKRRVLGIPQTTPGTFEVSALRSLLGTESPVILEIGCNDGCDTRQFLSLFESPMVHCFEPDPRARDAFRQNVIDPRAVLHALAIGDRDGTVNFHASGGASPNPEAVTREGGWDLSGSIRRPKKHLKAYPWVTFDAIIDVEAKRLDTWAAEHSVDHVDFIWADVQGAEMDLIRGGTRTLERTRYFYTEYSNSEMYEGQASLRQLIKALPQFEPVVVYSEDVLFRNRRS